MLSVVKEKPPSQKKKKCVYDAETQLSRNPGNNVCLDDEIKAVNFKIQLAL